jgi:radical SAM superfamily enzyme YgiQ (UPF0313 family)
MAQTLVFSDASFSDENADDIFLNVPVRSAGPYRIATEIRNKGLDCFVLNFIYHFSLEEMKKVCESLINSDTILVGLSTTFWAFPKDPDEHNYRKEILKIIVNTARRYPKIKLILGGTSARFYSDYINADACFLGYAEPLLNLFLDSVLDNKSFDYPPTEVSVKNTPIYKFIEGAVPFDFNNSVINYHPYDFIEKGESLVTEIARGCVFSCKFCAYPLNGKSKLDYIKHAEVIKNELINNYETNGTTNYTFADDTFNDSTYKIEYLHKIFKELPFNIKFGTYLRLDLLNAHKEQIPLLKDMGMISPFFGVETLSKNAGSKVGKSMDSNKVTDLLFELKDSHWGHRIKVLTGFITGIPGEDQTSFELTKAWINDRKNNLVDRVRPAALGIPNPLTDRSIWKSDFQLNASKYGFYWPNKSSNWKNLSSWTRSYESAKTMASELLHEAVKNNRHRYGWSMLSFPAWSDNAVNLDQLLEMSREDYTKWFDQNVEKISVSFIKRYKDKVMNIL